MKKPIVKGNLSIDMYEVHDQYSLMELFKRAVKKQWGGKEKVFSESDFWEMLQEYMVNCPKKCQYPSELEMALNEMPDHFCQRGKKKEFSLLIVKDKKNQWQILYSILDEVMFRGFSEDKNYPSLLDAVRSCKKFLTSRQWKK